MRTILQNKIKESLRAKDSLAANVYRGAIAAIQEREIRENKTFSDDEIMGIIEKESNSYLETAKGFYDRGDSKLYDLELQKNLILNLLLPQKIPVEEYDTIIEKTILELDAKTMRDMGRVVKSLKDEYGIQLDMKIVSQKIKEKLL